MNIVYVALFVGHEIAAAPTETSYEVYNRFIVATYKDSDIRGYSRESKVC